MNPPREQWLARLDVGAGDSSSGENKRKWPPSVSRFEREGDLVVRGGCWWCWRCAPRFVGISCVVRRSPPLVVPGRPHARRFPSSPIVGCHSPPRRLPFPRSPFVFPCSSFVTPPLVVRRPPIHRLRAPSTVFVCPSAIFIVRWHPRSTPRAVAREAGGRCSVSYVQMWRPFR
jgi:hypothetical protein